MNDNPYGMITPPPRKRRHRVRNTILAVLAALAGLIIIVIAAGSGSSTSTGAGPAVSETNTPASSATATASAGPDKVCFAVVGTGQPSISYGNDSDNRDAGGKSGPLSDGNGLPWKACMRADRSASYWDVTAQLEGGGDITATVTEVRGDGTSKLLATAHAAGGYQVAAAGYAGFVGP
jgi:hypothetical protein